jgi:hypothetical protein
LPASTDSSVPVRDPVAGPGVPRGAARRAPLALTIFVTGRRRHAAIDGRQRARFRVELHVVRRLQGKGLERPSARRANHHEEGESERVFSERALA